MEEENLVLLSLRLYRDNEKFLEDKGLDFISKLIMVSDGAKYISQLEGYKKEIESCSSKIQLNCPPTPSYYTFINRVYQKRLYLCTSGDESRQGKPQALLNHLSWTLPPRPKPNSSPCHSLSIFETVRKAGKLRNISKLRGVSTNGAFRFDKKAKSVYNFHGFGPVWRNNSCWLDSMVFVLVQLEAGITVVDQLPLNEKLPGIASTARKVARLPWLNLTVEEASKERDDFWKALVLENNVRYSETKIKFDDGEPRGFGFAADLIFPTLAQLCYKSIVCAICPSCSALYDLSKQVPKVNTFWDIAPRKAQASMEAGLNAMFAPYAPQGPNSQRRKCTTCNEQSTLMRQIIVTDGMPERLAVHTIEDGMVSDALSDKITISWRYAETGALQSTKYKWLGHVVATTGHFYVDWLEGGEGDARTYKTYDGLENTGALQGGVIGGFLVQDKEKKILKLDGDAYLFYERVDG